MKRIAILLLACCLLLCACAAPESPAAAIPEAAPGSEGSLLGDYELLWTELEESYPYLPYLEQRGSTYPGSGSDMPGSWKMVPVRRTWRICSGVCSGNWETSPI